MSTKQMLCVGGPRSGERHALLYGSTMRFYIDDRIPIASSEISSGHKPTVINPRFADYEIQKWHMPDGVIELLVPVRQTPRETMTMLLNAFERPKPCPAS
jgi:hypothetical protein